MTNEEALELEEHKERFAILRKEHKEIEEANAVAYREWLEVTSRPLDADSARLNLFIDMLVEWGVVSQTHQLEFEIAFQKQFAESLKSFWKLYREQKAEHEKKSKLSLPNKGSKLFGPDGRIIK